MKNIDNIVLLKMDNATIRQKLFEISETMKDVTIETAKIVGLQSDLCVVKDENKGIVRKVQQLESEVVVVKDENKGLVRKVQQLENEMSVSKEENKGLVRKVQQLESEVSVSKEDNKGLVRKVQQLESEVVELKSVNCETKSEFSEQMTDLKSEFSKRMTDLKSENLVLKNINKTIIQRLTKVEESMLSSQAGQTDESIADADKISDCHLSQGLIDSQDVSDEAGPSTVSATEANDAELETIVKKPKAQRKREQVN